MTSIATAWAWAQPLVSTTKLVLLALAEQAGGTGHRVALDDAVPDLMRRTGLSRRAVQIHLRRLEATAHVVAEERTDVTGARLANRWHLNVDGLAPVPLPIATAWKADA